MPMPMPVSELAWLEGLTLNS